MLHHGVDQFLIRQRRIAEAQLVEGRPLVAQDVADLHRRGITHGDAMAENVLIDPGSGSAHWFDFETLHDEVRALEWRRADDVRALLATCLLRTPRAERADTLHMIVDAYADEAIVPQLAAMFGSPLRPSLVAPGVNVAGLRTVGTVTGVAGLPSADTERLSLTEMPYYTTASGTSFSAPQVAGAVALMLEADPTLTPAEVKDILSRTATPMPKYFVHEAGAGMLNTHAAVLEAQFPERRMGVFRAAASANALKFVTEQLASFEEIVTPGSPTAVAATLPQDTVQADFGIVWGPSANDFRLSVFGQGGNLAGESNRLNLAGLFGRRELVSLRSPAPQTFSISTSHTAGAGTVQSVSGTVTITRAQLPMLADLAGLSPQTLDAAERAVGQSDHGVEVRARHRAERQDQRGEAARGGVDVRVLPHVSHGGSPGTITLPSSGGAAAG